MSLAPRPRATPQSDPSSPTPFPPADTPTSPPPTETTVPAASTLPDPASYAWELVASGLTRPVDLTHAGDGSGRLFVVEQVGVIRIIQDGQVLDPPFLDLRDRVGAQSNEQGLLGLAFHPEYAVNGYFYVNYTDFRGNTHLARFQRTEDPNRADPASEMELLSVEQPYPNHNGGGLAFGPEGNLYAGLGDGGSAGDPQGNGQSTDTLLGKVLRLDVNVEPYGIPADNPFVDGGGRPEIWAYGLRNPWRLAFDPLTGDLYIGDVGQNAWEEIDFQPAGAPGGLNYGWVYREGQHQYQGNPPADLSLVEPVAEYDHGQGCSVTGGVVYRGGALPAWQGVYLYGDYCTGRVWGLLRGADGGFQSAFLFATEARISSFGADEAGEAYLVDLQGNVYRLVAQ